MHSSGKQLTGVVTLEDIEAEPWYKNFEEEYKQALNEDRSAANTLWTKVALWKGDITKLQVDAIVNAANSTLLGGRGVDGSIHKAAGPNLKEECYQLNGCDPGQAKITNGHNLPASYVIHTVGTADNDADVLRSCYTSCFRLMMDNGLKSVAFPCISTGTHGFAKDKAADIALTTALEWLEQHYDEVEKIVFCVFTTKDFDLYTKKLPAYFGPKDTGNWRRSSGQAASRSKTSVAKPEATTWAVGTDVSGPPDGYDSSIKELPAGVVTPRDIDAKPWYKNFEGQYIQVLQKDRSVANKLWTKVALWQGDITKLQVHAIVNAAKSNLLGGGGVDGSIHTAAGPNLKKECEKLGGCNKGDAKITRGYKLPAMYVIHTVGPQDGNADVLKSCYSSCFRLMEEYRLESVAFPCIATGIYGFPNDKAADIALSTTREWLEQHVDKVQKIVFCVFHPKDFELYMEKLPAYFGPKDTGNLRRSSRQAASRSRTSVAEPEAATWAVETDVSGPPDGDDSSIEELPAGVVTPSDIDAKPWYKNFEGQYIQALQKDRSVANKLWTKVALWQGDITKLQVYAIVNAAKSNLLGGGGVDGAIHTAAGPNLKKECEKLGGCDEGDAKITMGYKLPAMYVIHTVGPQDRNADVLRSCYSSCFRLIEKYKLESVAFPCIATGIYGFPNDKAADIALSTTREWLEQHVDEVQKIVFCVFHPKDFELYTKKLPVYFGPKNA